MQLIPIKIPKRMQNACSSIIISMLIRLKGKTLQPYNFDPMTCSQNQEKEHLCPHSPAHMRQYFDIFTLYNKIFFYVTLFQSKYRTLPALP